MSEKEENPSKGSFRRAKSRAPRACEVCHTRKVRCDVTVHMPCTNCAAFGCECRIPEMKSRKPRVSQTKKTEDRASPVPRAPSTGSVNDVDDVKGGPFGDHNGINGSQGLSGNGVPAISSANGVFARTNGGDDGGDQVPTVVGSLSDQQATETTDAGTGAGAAAGAASSQRGGIPTANKEYTPSDSWFHLFESKVQGPGRVAFLGSTSNLNLLLDSNPESYHYSLPSENSGRSRLSEMDKEEVDVLKIRGAFLLPSREVCDDLVECYFEKVHPIIPVINRAKFMRQYNDPSNPPSLLLFQALLLAGSRVCHNPALKDVNGSTELASLTFYKRAKALYDANYEMDRISLVQSSVLMGWWWENPEDVTKNIYYWNRVSITIAQGFGMHRSVEGSKMSDSDKKMWKRIWWTLFTRDRSVSMALGRPLMIHLDDCDVPMITEQDFDEDEPGIPSPYPLNRVQALYFINAVKLSEIIGYALKQQFSVGAERSKRQNKYPSISHSDMAMASWMKNLPEELRYSVGHRRSHDFYKALLHAQYYTVLCLVHRSNVVERRHQDSQKSGGKDYPSWGIAFQSAHMISMICENMRAFNELEDSPAFMTYTLFSALIMLLYQTESRSAVVSERAHAAIRSSLESLQVLGRTWMVARMIAKLVEQVNESPKIKEKIVYPVKRYYLSLGQGKKRALDETSVGGAATGSNKQNSHVNGREKRQNGGSTEGRASIFTEYPADGQLSSSAATSTTGNTDNTTANTSPGTTTATGGPTAVEPSALSTAGGSAPVAANTGTGPTAVASPEFHFVTNASPSNQTGFLENFQPSQLFPESNEINLSGNMSSSSNSSTPGMDLKLDKMDLSPSMLGVPEHLHLSPPADASATPSSLSLGDWYQFLVNNTEAQTEDATED